MSGDSGTPEKPRRTTGVYRATGRDRVEWFGLLDSWGAAGREYREIADWLTGEQGLSDWWAQKLIVEYEQERGLRAPGARSDGTFTVTSSKTIGVPVDRLYLALADPGWRRHWLPGVSMTERASQVDRSIRFDWEDGASRVNCGLVAKGATRSQLAVEHVRIPDASTAEELKAFWRERLDSLQAWLESEAPPPEADRPWT